MKTRANNILNLRISSIKSFTYCHFIEQILSSRWSIAIAGFWIIFDMTLLLPRNIIHQSCFSSEKIHLPLSSDWPINRTINQLNDAWSLISELSIVLATRLKLTPVTWYFLSFQNLIVATPLVKYRLIRSDKLSSYILAV